MPATPPPPPGTNARILHDLTVAINASPALLAELDRIKAAPNLSTEIIKRPDLMAAGAIFAPGGPALGSGMQAGDIETIPRHVVLTVLRGWVEHECDQVQKEKIRTAGILDIPDDDDDDGGNNNNAAAESAARKNSKGKAGPPKKSTEKRRLPTRDDFDPGLDSDENGTFKWTCNQVRRKINAFLESGEMKVTAFQRHLGINSNSYNRFMKMNQPWQGIDNSTMSAAYRFFRQRERNGITIPPKRKQAGAAPASDAIADITLDGDTTDDVQVYDSCDEIRRKINAYLKKDGVTQAAFLRDLARMYHTEEIKLQSKQLNDFRGKSGADAGNTSRIFYCAYVFFEKLRLKEGKPKTKHRLQMESIWRRQGGLDTKRVKE